MKIFNKFKRWWKTMPEGLRWWIYFITIPQVIIFIAWYYFMEYHYGRELL